MAVHIVGGGLAGCEAAWQLARAGVPAVIHEMRPVRATDAHHTDNLAELVCSNSFRSDDAQGSAIGLLHAEMRALGSLVLAAADANRVPAGSALAVDRDGFSAAVQGTLEAEPLVSIRREEIIALPPHVAEGDPDPSTSASGRGWDSVIVATGPLTSAPLAEALAARTGEGSLAFFDAIAPIVERDSIDFSKAWFQSRYDKGASGHEAATGSQGPGGQGPTSQGLTSQGSASQESGRNGADYINCPLDRDQYEAFIDALLAADKTAFHEWERNTPYFEGCLPIEVMAERGRRTLAFGPMKPVGLSNPHDGGRRPYAVVQLRQDNALATLYNMVGFQTKLKHGEQARIFRMIPGLEQARFARLGGIHRNTFVNSPRLLDETLRVKALPAVRLAGQITGCEGYVESAAIGLLAGRFAAAERRGLVAAGPPGTTALGALLGHITGGARAETFQPMNVTFGLFPPLTVEDGVRPPKGAARKQALARRALADLERWMQSDRMGGWANTGAGAAGPAMLTSG